MRNGEIEPDRLFGAALFDPARKTPDVRRWLNEESYEQPHHHAHGHDHDIATFCLTFDQPLDWMAVSDWLGRRPSAQAIEHWQHFVATAFRDLSPEEREQLRSGVLRLAEDVARATGGFLGLGSKISTEEQAVLDRIARAFA